MTISLHDLFSAYTAISSEPTTTGRRKKRIDEKVARLLGRTNVIFMQYNKFHAAAEVDRKELLQAIVIV